MQPKKFPGPVRTDESNAFASNTMRVRVPDILQQVLDVNPDMPQPLRDNVGNLRQEIARGANMQPLNQRGTSEAEGWQEAFSRRAGESWHGTDWFFAETYTYRRLMEAVDYWNTRVDPFAPIKRHEYASEQHQFLLDTALAVEADREEVLHSLIGMDLWGNRVDLSYAESRTHGMDIMDDDLLVDDRAAILAHLATKVGHIHVVADNAGSELTLDLVLIDALLRDGWATRVTLHVKAHPTFVSDAIRHDVEAFLAACRDGEYGAAAEGMAARLAEAAEQGRFTLGEHIYWNSSLLWWEMPDSARAELQAASLVIVKGDANYRRVVGDAVWPYATPFAEVVSTVGIPVACIRTLKSDPIVGLPEGLGERLESVDERWRWSGKRGLIQAYLPEA